MADPLPTNNGKIYNLAGGMHDGIVECGSACLGYDGDRAGDAFSGDGLPPRRVRFRALPAKR